ncbi:MAG TPA: hypothetical protein VHV51_23725 [Polyangiaceae bacterium]|jgi:hypothetical protein|nr:hypothetical protein [Polyangiaceae bacterium]
MKPRTALLVTALTLIAACSGKNVLLGGAPLTRGGMGGVTEGGAGATTTTGGSATAGTLNVDGGNEVVPCADGGKTTISGTVWDPGKNTPLYNAVVYVPSDNTPPSFTDQVACEKCGAQQIKARAVALSDSNGHFVLDTDVPDTPNVELAVQLGKWFRQMTVKVNPCQPNTLTDKDLTRLPQSKADGEYSHIPKIALSTGHSDALECLLRKIGIDLSEFTTDAGDGRVNMFVGCINDTTQHYGANHFVDGTMFPSTNQLFDTPGELNQYDVVIFSCEGHKCSDTQDSPTPIQTAPHIAQLVDFANHGGRVYLDHDHYNWLNHIKGDELQDAAEFSSSSTAPPSPLPTNIDTDFPKGQAFAQWLVNVNASTTLGSLDIFSSKTSVENIYPPAQSWIYQTGMYADFFYFTIGTPFTLASDTSSSSDGTGGEGGASNTNDTQACGRVVFTDLHVSKSGGGCDATTTTCGETDDMSDQNTPFPLGCTSTGLLPQEKALEFMLFDLTSCVQKETEPPAPPPVVVK